MYQTLTENIKVVKACYLFTTYPFYQSVSLYLQQQSHALLKDEKLTTHRSTGLLFKHPSLLLPPGGISIAFTAPPSVSSYRLPDWSVRLSWTPLVDCLELNCTLIPAITFPGFHPGISNGGGSTSAAVLLVGDIPQRSWVWGGVEPGINGTGSHLVPSGINGTGFVGRSRDGFIVRFLDCLFVFITLKGMQAYIICKIMNDNNNMSSHTGLVRRSNTINTF